MHSIANAYIDCPAVAFTTSAQFLPTERLRMILKALSEEPDQPAVAEKTEQ
jgi:hypothetical protein